MNRYVKYILLICFCLTEEDFPFDPEDVSETSQEFELTDISQQPYKSRIRFVPNSLSKEWHFHQLFQHKMFTVGVRIDENKTDDKFDISRLFLSKGTKNYSIILGSIKAEFGQGLVFSNEFGKFKSYSSIMPISKNHDVFKANLNSKTQSSIEGIALQFDTKTLHNKILITQGNRVVESNNSKNNIYAYYIKKELQTCNIGFIFAKETVSYKSTYQNYYSGIFSKQFENIKVNGEVVFSKYSTAYIINCSSKTEEFHWLIQKRHLPTNWSNITGIPFTEFKKGKNEKGILFYCQYKEERLIIGATIDVFSEIRSEENLSKNFGYDKRIMISYNINELVKLEIRHKQKRTNNEQQNIQFGVSHSYFAPILKRTSEAVVKIPQNNGFIFKYKLLEYCPNIEKKEKGRLITISFPKLFIKEWRITSCIRWFSTDSWDSRLYAYVPGLSGEFPIKTFYGKGWQSFLKCEYGLSTQTDVSFRGSCEWKNEPLITFAIQMDVNL